jgi:hypothetical protein
MASDTASKSTHFADGRMLQDEASRSDRLAGLMMSPLTRRASLIVTLLLSLALWAAIWAAVASLASAMLG